MPCCRRLVCQVISCPEGLDPIVGTFDRVGAVALNAVLATGVCVGESVAVFGLGVIGLLATQLLIAQGNEVLAVDTMPHRLKLAEGFGAASISRAGRRSGAADA